MPKAQILHCLSSNIESIVPNGQINWKNPVITWTKICINPNNSSHDQVFLWWCNGRHYSAGNFSASGFTTPPWLLGNPINRLPKWILKMSSGVMGTQPGIQMTEQVMGKSMQPKGPYSLFSKVCPNVTWYSMPFRLHFFKPFVIYHSEITIRKRKI